jgi:phage recombination protein Bet
MGNFMTGTQVANIVSRLPMPQGVDGVNQGQWRVLCESVFPSARTAEAVVMAVDYCRARKLDIFKKPVHIVPMWSASLGREVETVWPSINEVQTTASRTREWAGMDEPKWGKEIVKTFKGVKKNNVGETVIEMSIPEWCSVTVYRMINGQKCAFTEPVYWLEAYGRLGKTELPNDGWAKRPRGMIIKVAKAFSLRAAFPEEGFYVAEEMEGHVLEETGADGVVIDGNEPLKTKSIFKNATLRNTFIKNVTASLKEAKTLDELRTIASLNKPKIDEMEANKNEHDLLAVEELRNQLALAQERLKNPDPTPEEDVDTFTKEEAELNEQMKNAMGG